ncbi:siderophore-interacting protein [Leucobacter musarum]|uniref:siderophore-interacting protein n=1 Tax=Leucobacter musarum TaxID=1930747 RepID=UPI0006A7AFC6|nr:siderophore-interacting protein [Leucobacter musarum]
MAHSIRPLSIYPITTRTLEVLRVADVTPGMRRVTLGGADLAAHTANNGFPVAAFRSDGFDDEFKVLLPHPDAAEIVGPTQADGVLNWPRGDEHLVLRTYTVRRWDPEAGELDVDFVVHGTGAASTWAVEAQVGDRLQIAGPKMSAPHPVGADWTLIVGDETALPAIARWLDEWPTGARAQIFIEVAVEAHRQPLPCPDGVEITWLSRDGAEPGTTSLLFDAIRAAEWWPGTPFAWVAGETLTLIPIRRWLRGERGLAKAQVEVTGYWRRQSGAVEHTVAGASAQVAVDRETAPSPGAAATLETDTADTADTLADALDPSDRFHELTELLPAFAVRIAATIGLPAAFGGAVRTLEALAGRTGAHPHGLAKLLRYLEALELIETVEPGTTYRLTELGSELDDEDTVEDLDLDGLRAQRELGGALALLSAVRTGTGDFTGWFGTDWRSHASRPGTALDDRVAGEAQEADYVASALAESPAFDDCSSAALIGPGTGVLAAALVAHHAELRVTVLAAPSEIAVLQRLHDAHDRIAYEPAGSFATPANPADRVLLATVLAPLADADAELTLQRAAAAVTPGGALLVLEEPLDLDLADEHEFEDDLIDFALTGGGARTDPELRARFASAALPAPDRRTVGWGAALYSIALPQ